MAFLIEKKDSCATIFVEGRLDSISSPELQAKIDPLFDEVETMAFDFSNAEYVSSAGLRVLVGVRQKMIHTNGDVKILHPNEDIMEVFEITGLASAFTILP